MIFDFPLPLKKKSVWLEISVNDWDTIDAIKKERGITDEQVLSTIVAAAIKEYVSKYTPKRREGVLEDPKVPDIDPPADTIIISPEVDTEQEPSAEKPWARKYPNGCVRCGGTDKKHLGGGYCSACYFKRDKPAPLRPRKPRAKFIQEEPNVGIDPKGPLGDAKAKCASELHTLTQGGPSTQLFLIHKMVRAHDKYFCSDWYREDYEEMLKEGKEDE